MKKTEPIFLILLLVVFVLPLAVLALYGVSAGWRYPDVFPDRFSSRALAYIWSQRDELSRAMGYSILYSLLTTLTAFLICVFPAHVFARNDFPFKSLIEGLLLAPALAPAMTFSMGVHYLFIKAGLADTLAGVVLVLTVFTYPYMLRTLISGYLAYGEEYGICAANLGAGPLMRLFRVELPLLMPAAIAGGSIVFLISFSEYFLVFLIGGGTVPSFAMYLFPFLTSSDRPVASLLTLIFLLIPIALFVLIDGTVNRVYRRRGLA